MRILADYTISVAIDASSVNKSIDDILKKYKDVKKTIEGDKIKITVDNKDLAKEIADAFAKQ